jgi:hypothetical protein
MDDLVSSCAVRFIPWPPNWEEGLDHASAGHGSQARLNLSKPSFTETERELSERGVELIVGVKSSLTFVDSNSSDLILDPASSHSTGHFRVHRLQTPSDHITLRKEGSEYVLLEAEKQTGGKGLWRIKSPMCSLGDCWVVANPKHSSFYVIKDGFEEAAICYKKAPANAQLRFFDVIIPALQKENMKRMPIRFDGHTSYLMSQGSVDTVASDCVRLSVREPTLEAGRWVLMFSGRVKRASRKNFILVHPKQPNREILLCGKAGVKQFVFDLNWPLSVLQGFAVYLTLFSKPKPS